MKKRKLDSSDTEPTNKGLSPFIKHFKHKVNDVDVKYKVGDAIWKDEKWYFCDFATLAL